MKKEIKELWIKALNSGKYVQGKGRLRSEDNFCCLGVLCDLYNKGNWERFNDNDGEGDYYDYLAKCDVLPLEVVDWAGLKQDNPSIPYTKGYPNLASLNDKGKTFKQIAKIIKKYI